MTQSEQNDTRASAEGDQKQSAKFWFEELAAAEKREAKWHKRAQKVVQRYRDERDLEDRADRRTNVLWSNTEVLKSVLFQGIGNPDVRRKFPKRGKEQKISRQAALVLENAVASCVEDYDSDSPVESVVEDHVLAGRGQAWVVYDATVEPSEEGGDKITYQSLTVQYVFWQDYRTSAGRTEADIWWKGRCHKYSRDELKSYFPDDADAIQLTTQMSDQPYEGKSEDDTFKRANVWEIWDKNKRQRVYVAEGHPTVLRADDDPYNLKEFFPCPPALYGVKTTSSLVPIPEYTLYQDQAEELDAITTRLHRLIDALKRRGVYDAASDGGADKLAGLATADDNEFIPYKGFAQLMEKGGLKNVFQTEDLSPIINVVQGLYQQRQLLIQTIYEVTGISDIVRGSSDPRETLGAQKIKSQFGSMRLNRRQDRVQRFIRDLLRIKAELIAEHFTREKLVEMSGIELPLQIEIDQAQQQLAMLEQAQQQPQPGQTGQMPGQPGQMPGQQMEMGGIDPDEVKDVKSIAESVSWEEVSSILRSDESRSYKLDIETQTTVDPDNQEEKQARIEFMTMMQAFLERIIPAVNQYPPLAPLARELTMFGLRAFKIGRTLEESFTDAFQALEDQSKQPQQPETDELEVAKTKQILSGIERDNQMHKAKLETMQKDLQFKGEDAQFARQDQQLDNAIKVEHLKGEFAARAQDSDLKQQDADLKLAEAVQGALERHRASQGYVQ